MVESFLNDLNRGDILICFSKIFEHQDPFDIGLDGPVRVEIFDPVRSGDAWEAKYRLIGSKSDYEGRTFGESELQSVELAARFIRVVYEPHLGSVDD